MMAMSFVYVMKKNERERGGEKIREYMQRLLSSDGPRLSGSTELNRHYASVAKVNSPT